jgi:hypothetical protein
MHEEKDKKGLKIFEQKTTPSKLLRGLTRYNFLPHPRECKRKIKKELR